MPQDKPTMTWLARRRLEFGVAILSALLLLFALAPLTLITIPPGSVGVLWLRLFGGTVFNFHYGEGLKVVLPWDHVYVYDTRLRRLDLTISALSGDGLEVKTDVTLRYKLNPDTTPDLYALVGPRYESRLLEPSLTSEVTTVIVARKAVDLYILAHDDLEFAIADGVRKKLQALDLHRSNSGALITIVSFTMRRVILPQSLQDAIGNKLSAQQMVGQYDYIIQRERQESERKAIEAEGIRRFQEIISSSISDSYLRWRGIDATLRLAESPNSKVVVVGNGPGAMPLILGGMEDTHPSTGPTASEGSRLPIGAASTPSSASNEGSSPTPQPVAKSSDRLPLPEGSIPPQDAGKAPLHQ